MNFKIMELRNYIDQILTDSSGPTEVTKDEYPRSGSTFEGFQKLRPAFVKDGTGSVTAGNASGMTLHGIVSYKQELKLLAMHPFRLFSILDVCFVMISFKCSKFFQFQEISVDPT